MLNEELKKVVQRSEEHEYYTPMPQGYEKGRTKFVAILGTVMSGLGKGIVSSSLAKLLQNQKLTCVPIKMEGYLNVDSGTLNPFRHGEVFVLDDGTECDMDLGTYERMLDVNLTRDSFVTSGQIFQRIISKERKGEYLGRDVQVIPHVTGEIKWHLRKLAHESQADVVLVEIGGTIGDIENSHYVEAIRQLSHEEGEGNMCFFALTYILEPHFLGEQKSKAAQLGIRLLLEHGIQPHIIGCRCPSPVTQKVKEKISIYTNVPVERVVSVHDVESIYTIPQVLEKEGVAEQILDILRLRGRAREDEYRKGEWDNFTKKVTKKKDKSIAIGIAGKYTDLPDAYASIIKALEHCEAAQGITITTKWLETTQFEKDPSSIKQQMQRVDGIIVPGGFGKRGVEGKILCAQYARENKIPYLGLCLGFQVALIDFARHVCKLPDAHTTEIATNTKHPVVDILPSQRDIEELGGNMRLGGRDVLIKEKTMAWKLYGKRTSVRERFRHRYECNPDYITLFEKHGIVFSGHAPYDEIMQILELPDHPYFIATQFHPEFTSRPLTPQPLFVGLIAAAKKRRT